MYQKLYENNNGFTLIEIIASIAILGMVIAVFLPIFPQIMQWSNNADDELVASNLLGQVTYDIKQLPLVDSTTINSCPDMKTITGLDSLGESATYVLNNREYRIELNICQEIDVDLYRTNIRIYSPDHKLVSESYTYIGESNE
ncbi:prepilin-type N-terminal cleavage/methylation domain-containing protein [Ornithinibacillus sp. L9]|uniref:Prepilin-type N-terminal cleavage/methylation domain-containing protein n=1 Tax=Ornithinibacillus caprae TaxID=2678566 RepID=A0A6N8FBD8_9BACI|nr:type II secretion system protein [Ornithinibacillus caprae]MUK86850.1 prepilin-type N-terminal cleavage/methylation domain-containing protein [Ornithinibacillus caprae]